jgi:hypothetical protein
VAIPGNRRSPFVGSSDESRRHRRRISRIREDRDHPQVGETQLLRARRVDVPRQVEFRVIWSKTIRPTDICRQNFYRQSFGRKPLGQQIFGRLNFDQQTFGQNPLGRQSFG